MRRLYGLFEKARCWAASSIRAPSGGNLLLAEFHDLQPLLARALEHETADDAAHELAVTAQGVAKAAEILASQFALVLTNVPYVGRDKQDEVLKEHCGRVYPEAKADLATCFIERCLAFCCERGTVGLVTPQSWLYQDSFKKMRPPFNKGDQFEPAWAPGPGAFEGISGEVVNVCLVAMTRARPVGEHTVVGLDVSDSGSVAGKREGLIARPIEEASQKALLKNPHAKISLDELGGQKLLAVYATSHLGICYRRLQSVWAVLLGVGRPFRCVGARAYYG